MPKIAASIQSNQAKAPVEFYVHLGDLRRMFDIDCDMAIRQSPGFDCKTRKQPLGRNAMNDYLNHAWSDFVDQQIKPFGSLPFFVGIGNHELYANRTRQDFERTFQPWLTQEVLHSQRMSDAGKGILTNEGDTTYHFVHRGVDFIYLDNADGPAFTASQVLWLSKILAVDAKNAEIKTIVVGLHAALPFSKARGHAMDDSCQGRCSGEQVYDMLYRAQNLEGPADQQKEVYVIASHSHLFLEDVYNTPEHRGQVLPGWIVGTAGAEQYTNFIRYGYLLVEVRPDGTLHPDFREVTAQSPPLAEGPGAEALTKFCFEQNKHPVAVEQPVKMECSCGAAK
ncbi:MAG: metallophosphoesterase [Acidobacteriia bacterium]|nr:metallophosphoesterase [Terriglobia bacterium]